MSNVKAKVLIADDDRHQLAATSRLLRNAGFEVFEASDGDEALRGIENFQPDIAILDMVMPGLTGMEVCGRVKEHPLCRNTFVVILSATMNTPDNQADGLESGADGYISRPISNRELLARVDAMVRIKKTEQELRYAKGILEGVLNASSDGIIAFKSVRDSNRMISDFTYLQVNRVAGEILGNQPGFFIGKRLLDIFPGHLESGLFLKYASVADTGTPLDIEFRYDYENKNGWYRIIAQPYEDGLVVTFSDITALKEKEEELTDYATTDPLTGLLNRRTGLAILEDRMNISRREQIPLTVCFADVNDLKTVNDTYGHNEGDELLKIVADILKESLRESDALCRMGGDEFLFILPQCSKNCSETIWERIKAKTGEINSRGIKPYEVSLSHGFAEYRPGDQVTAGELVEMADRMMYIEKRAGKVKKKNG